MRKNLSPLQLRFVELYRESRNATDAYRRAYKPKTTNERTIFRNAFAVLNNPTVQAKIQAENQARADRLNVTPDMLAKRLWDVITANPNEIMQHRRGCCRHCYGVDFRYQWTEQEYFDAARKAPKESPPDASGGLGYQRKRRPHPDCTECGGEGVDRVFITDSRDLSPQAALLYQGVKRTKEGIEIKFYDVSKAIDQFTRLVGFDVSKLELTGANGSPLVPPSEMSDEQLMAIVAAAKNG